MYYNNRKAGHIQVDGNNTKYIITEDAEVYNIETGDLVPQYISNAGYLMIHVKYNGKTINRLVHREFAKHFVPNPDPEKYNIVNHINGIKTDISIENLEWTDISGNSKHARMTGLSHHKDVSKVDINMCQVIESCKLMETGKYKLREISKIVDLPLYVLKSIQQGEIYYDISRRYNVLNCIDDLNTTTLNTIHEIANLIIESELMLDEIAEKVGVAHAVVCDIYHKNTYKYILKDYDFSHYDKYQRYDASFLDSIQQLMSEGYSNVEIRKLLNLEKGSKTNTLLYRQRKKYNSAKR